MISLPIWSDPIWQQLLPAFGEMVTWKKHVKTFEVKDIEIFHLLVGQVIVEEKEALGSQL